MQLRMWKSHCNFLYLVVEAAAAYDALHGHNAIDLLDGGQEHVERLLDIRQGLLVVVGRPLESPLSRDGIKLDPLGDGDLVGELSGELDTSTVHTAR